MYYYSTDERKGKWIGAVATLLYVVVWVGLMLFVSFSYQRQETTDGILMDLVGDPGEASVRAEQLAQVQSVQASQPEAAEQELLTQEHEEAPVREQVQKPKPEPKKETPKPAEKPRQVNPNAMFRPAAKSNATTTASATASDESGAGKGGYDGGSKGSGGGGVDAVHSVGNRSLVGSLPPPADYGRNKKGKVVIEIYVDSNGYVARTPTYRAQGSTTNDSELIRVAIEAARKARFTTAENDVPQVGTITYTFKLR